MKNADRWGNPTSICDCGCLNFIEASTWWLWSSGNRARGSTATSTGQRQLLALLTIRFAQPKDPHFGWGHCQYWPRDGRDDQNSLKEDAPGRTTITIAHRLSVQDAGAFMFSIKGKSHRIRQPRSTHCSRRNVLKKMYDLQAVWWNKDKQGLNTI